MGAAEDEGGGLPGPRDLRQRRLRRGGRGREDRGRRGRARSRRLDVTDDKQRGGRPRDRQGRASRRSTRAPSCTIRPQSLIGEKFVECTPGPGLRRRAARRSRTATARASTLLVEHTQLAGRHRPGQQHAAPALPPAARDPPQRVRHRPRRPRRRPERGDPPRQPGAARDRPGAGDPGRPEPHAAPTCARDVGHRAGAAGRAPRARVELHRPRERDRPGHGRAARRHRALDRAPAASSCASCARRWPTSAASSDEFTPVLRRRARRRARPEPLHRRARARSRRRRSRRWPRSATPPTSAARRFERSRPLIRDLGRVRRATPGPVAKNLDDAHEEPRRDRRHRARRWTTSSSR